MTLKWPRSFFVTLRRGLKSGEEGRIAQSELREGEDFAMKVMTTRSAKTQRDKDDAAGTRGVLVAELFVDMTS